MPSDNLEVNEGASGEQIRTEEIETDLHLPLHGLILSDGNGNWLQIRRRGHSLRMSLEKDEVGVASEQTLADQNSYDELEVDPTFDSSFSEPYNAVRLASASGDLEVVTGAGNTKTIPAAHLAVGQILPITVKEVKSSGTTVASSDIMLLRN